MPRGVPSVFSGAHSDPGSRCHSPHDPEKALKGGDITGVEPKRD